MGEVQYRQKLEVQRTNLATILIAVVAALLGLGALYWSNIDTYWTGQETLQGLVRDLGGLFFVTVAITVLWELTAKRAFLDELLTKARISQQVAASGLVNLSYEPYTIDWESLFQTTRHINLFFAYGKNWRGTHETRLERMASTAGCTIRVVLPDPDDEYLLNDLAERFNKSSSGIRERILDAYNDFSSLKDRHDESGSSVEVWYTKACPVFTIYQFDRVAVLSLYSYQRTKAGVPHLVATQGGSLYEFVAKEHAALTDASSGMSRRVI